MRKSPVFALCCAAFSVLALSCQKADPADERARRAARSTGDIRIAAVGAWGQDSDQAKAWNGIEMAVEEVNRTGVIDGRKFLLIKKDDKGTVDGSMLAAEEISSDADIVAVIGHTSSFSTVPCSDIYAAKGLLHVSPIAKSPELLERNNKLIVDLQVTTVRAAQRLADFARDRGYKDIAVSYVYDEYGTRFASEFEKAAAALGIKVVDSVPYWLEGKDNFGSIAAKWKSRDFDALLFAGHHEDTNIFIAKIRQSGLKQPILTDTAFSAAAVEGCPRYLDGVVTTSYFDSEPDEPIAQAFIKAYTGRYGIAPGRYSANSYEAVKLLAEGMKRAGSTVPAKVAEALRTVKEWQGLGGKYRVAGNGGVEGKTLLLMEFRNCRFEKTGEK